MNQPHIKVLSGEPTDHEVAALTAVITQIDAEERNKAAQTTVTRDNWTSPVEAGNAFNASAFRNVRYY